MNDDINFSDLFALTKITSDSVVEKFGGIINSSFFDAANILGGLKLSGLIDFGTTLGSQNPIVITQGGKELLQQVSARANDPFDKLDMSILNQLSNGKKSANDVTTSINVAHKDMTFHLYKLLMQGYISAEFRNGILNIMLTEKGFMQAKNGIPASVTPQVRNEPQMDKNTMPPQPQSSPSTIKQEPAAQKIQPITNATAPLQNDIKIPELHMDVQGQQQSTQTAAPMTNNPDISLVPSKSTTSKLPYILVIIAIVFLVVVIMMRFNIINI
jgi:hypothetical protein